jgi:hypothetical protein
LSEIRRLLFTARPTTAKVTSVSLSPPPNKAPCEFKRENSQTTTISEVDVVESNSSIFISTGSLTKMSPKPGRIQLMPNH